MTLAQIGSLNLTLQKIWQRVAVSARLTEICRNARNVKSHTFAARNTKAFIVPRGLTFVCPFKFVKMKNSEDILLLRETLVPVRLFYWMRLPSLLQIFLQSACLVTNHRMMKLSVVIFVNFQCAMINA